MHIGIDGSCLANRRGFGRFAREIVAALAAAKSPHQFTIYVDTKSREHIRIPNEFRHVSVDVGVAPSQAASARGRRSIRDLLAMSRAVARDRPDLMFFPASYTFFPVWGVRRVVVTMHDTLALAHPRLVFPTWRGQLAWAAKEHLAARSAHRILTVSEASRRDLISWFRLPPDRVVATTEGADDVFRPTPPSRASDEILSRHGVDPRSRYLIYVGGLSPHKNLPRLVTAFGNSAPSDVRLVLVGDFNDTFHTHVPAIRKAIVEANINGRVQFTGFVPDADLAHLYSRAEALVFPSLLEGFGLPAVEAMACGIPVLHSHAGSLPEVVGDAGIAFDPTCVDAIGAAIRQFYSDTRLRDDLRARAIARSKSFTWSTSAATILECFDSLNASDVRRSARLGPHLSLQSAPPRESMRRHH